MGPHSSLCKTGIIQWCLSALHCRSPFSKKGITSVHLKPVPTFQPGVVTSLYRLSWIYSITCFVVPPGFYLFHGIFL